MAGEKNSKREAGQIGGVKRAEALAPARRKEIAKLAAAARWGSKDLKATHKGSFKDEFGIDVDCFVLNDPNKTAVISQRGMGEALGLSSTGGGGALPRFLASKTMSEFSGYELQKKMENPMVFQWGGSGFGEQKHYGFDVAVLIDICQAIMTAAAKGKLTSRHAEIVKQAQIIVSASAKSGIKGLVYSLAGYNPTAEEVIAAFKLYVQEEAKKYEPEFPNELYQEWYRLYDIAPPARGRPWQFKYLTVNHIYYPLAKSNGRVLKLLREAIRAEEGDHQRKLHQFLNEVGIRALRMHLGRVLEMAESSDDRNAYTTKIANRFGGQLELELVPAYD